MSEICRAPNCDKIRDKKQASLLCCMHRVRWSRFKSYDLPAKYPPRIVMKCQRHGFLPIEKCFKRACNKWYLCKECDLARKKVRYAKNKGKWANQKRNYYFIKGTKLKILISEYNEILIKQNHVCKICKKPETMKAANSINKETKRLAIDHKNNKIRGLLCHRCNTGIGSFYDNIELIKSAITYLKKHQQSD